METRVKYFLTFFACLIIALGAFGGCTQQEVDNSQAIEAQKLAQRAIDTLQVQNTMSKHAYYHAAGKHIEEMNDIWVNQDGPSAKSATFSSPNGVWEGMELIMAYYGTYKIEMLKKNLEDISKIYPEVKNVPENIGIGGEWVIHTNTTPIIEVAGDGMTAKGIWYSPGISQSVMINDGKAETRGGWFWEKYAADFVKEDGEWKLWHLQMYYDNTPPGWGAEREAEPFLQVGERTEAPSFPQATRPNPDPYVRWSPTAVPRIQPRFPEPYYTFSETFSY
ncbi:nuclear transport factor 2 family protein [Deltaproteobacteria bacterium]|nr:nuclear transport factor 2 family protein [Deltaproteobacteria bacterium]